MINDYAAMTSRNFKLWQSWNRLINPRKYVDTANDLAVCARACACACVCQQDPSTNAASFHSCAASTASLEHAGSTQKDQRVTWMWNLRQVFRCPRLINLSISMAAQISTAAGEVTIQTKECKRFPWSQQIMQLYWVFTTLGSFYARSQWFHLLRNLKKWGVVIKVLCLFLPTVFDHRLLRVHSTKSMHDKEVKSTFFCSYLWPQLSSQEFLYFTRDKWQITLLFSIIRRTTLCRKWDRVQALLFC